MFKFKPSQTTESRLERLIEDYVMNGSKGDLILRQKNIIKLPSILKDVRVEGNFDCYGTQLTSLENAPKYVGGDFICSNSKLLTSLNDAPKYVGGNFFCSYCKLTSLDGAPEYVGGGFICDYNLLTTLTGAPKTVGGNFYCTDNPTKFTVKQVRTVCNVKGEVFV